MIEVLLSQAIDLSCIIEGTEPIDVEWQKNGQTIDLGGIRGGDNSYVQISSRGRKLHLLSSQVTDTGRYTCVARYVFVFFIFVYEPKRDKFINLSTNCLKSFRNSAGEARKTFDLRVLGECLFVHIYREI